MKKGANLIIYPFLITVALLVIVIIGSYIIESITPFICYQKLNNIASKYMFIIDKFGYLTQSEKEQMVKEIEKENIDTSQIRIFYPDAAKNYGQLLTLTIEYKWKKRSIISLLESTKRETILKITKNSFSKI